MQRKMQIRYETDVYDCVKITVCEWKPPNSSNSGGWFTMAVFPFTEEGLAAAHMYVPYYLKQGKYGVIKEFTADAVSSA